MAMDTGYTKLLYIDTLFFLKQFSPNLESDSRLVEYVCVYVYVISPESFDIIQNVFIRVTVS